ncbi:MAG: phosphoribosylaminoimidazolesuccinocarboxamide synthase [Eubacteriaceae bacterium]|nr:phosphoribosylaminoimidazolesuccinocarboxamide synthase [Eubacteriaceae bacterium]
MNKLEMLYEGKAKKVFKTENPDIYIIEYKDDATAFNALKKGTIVGKGVVNNKMSAIIFELLKDEGIPTHFVKLLSDTEQEVKAVKIVPLEVIIRNVAAGSFSKRLGVEEGSALKNVIFEICYKNDEYGDPLINDYHATALGLATSEELEIIKKYSFKINDILINFFKERGMRLIDFKIEFGRYNGEIVLADEISPDTCRLWEIGTDRKMDKDRFRRDLGNIEETYKEVLDRVQLKK